MDEMLLLKELREGVEGLNKYLNSDDSGDWNLRRVKKFIKSDTFARRGHSTIRKLYIMFDPSQKVSSEVLKKQFDLYVDFLNEGYQIDRYFPEFAGFVREMFWTKIDRLSDDKLFAMFHAVAKLGGDVQSKAIEHFKGEIPKLYLQDVDSMTNRHLSILIGHIKDKEFDELDDSMKNFVVELYKRCSVKTETADNNKNKLSTMDWFKANASNCFSQFNKAFFGIGLYENSILDEPTKKIKFEYLGKYADLQYKFIERMEQRAEERGLSVAGLIARSSDDLVYEVACECRKGLALPKFPEYDDSNKDFSKFYLREPREYKTSVAPKMTNLFCSMVKSKLKHAGLSGDTELMAQTISEFVSTRKMNNELVRIILDHRNEETFKDGNREIGKWLVGMTHLDELSRKSSDELIYVPVELLERQQRALEEKSMKKQEEQSIPVVESKKELPSKEEHETARIYSPEEMTQISFFEPGDEE